MMLARSSPISTTPANASPRSSFSFHYAPAPSPHYSSPRIPAVAKSRRPSSIPPHNPPPTAPVTTAPAPATTTTTTTTPSPVTAQPKRYVAVDAATQYSPMEPMDYATGALLPRVPPTTAIPDSRPAHRRKPMAAPEEQPAAVAQPLARPAKTAPPGPKQRVDSPSLIASPSKRRNSATALPPDAVQNPAVLSKRAKPAASPSKVLPLRYEFCPVEDMVVLIAHMLGELIETNDTLALKAGHLTRFHSRTAPGISVLDYLNRLAKHATLTPPLLLSMVYYIDRLCALYPDFTINTLTVHRFLITAATVAAKGLSDAFWNNSTYARVGGVKVAELKLLELEFLHRVDWKIVPNPEVLVAYYAGLVERCPGYTLEVEGANAGADSNGDDVDSSDALDESDEIDEDDEGVTEGQVEAAGSAPNV